MEFHDQDRRDDDPSQAPSLAPLNELVRRIRTREDLAAFVWALDRDRANHSTDWENSTLDRYLPALASYIEDADRYYVNQGEPVLVVPTWRMIGELLLAAKYYE